MKSRESEVWSYSIRYSCIDYHFKLFLTARKHFQENCLWTCGTISNSKHSSFSGNIVSKCPILNSLSSKQMDFHFTDLTMSPYQLQNIINFAFYHNSEYFLSNLRCRTSQVWVNNFSGSVAQSSLVLVLTEKECLAPSFSNFCVLQIKKTECSSI